jgi:Dickkopf N-terminal cysteine-rich region
MPKIRVLLLAAFLLSACEISEGNFDGSFFDDSSIIDDEDAGVDEDDAGKAPPKDAGKPDSGTAKDASVDPAPDLKPSDVPAIIARGRCKALETCMGKSLLRDAYEGNDCVPYVTQQLADRHLHWLAQSVSAGRVMFRPGSLDECERDIAKLGCSVTSSPLPDTCETAIEGKSAVDEGCWIDQDCKDTAYCDKGTQETCPGTCAALQSRGLPCTSSSQCSSGLVCESGSCTEPMIEGDSCDARMAGGACPPGLVCQGRSGSLTCQSVQTLYVGKLNEDCDALGKLCEFGLVCESQSSADTTGVCKPISDKGAQCRRSEPSQCPVDQYCKKADVNSEERVDPGVSGVCWDRPKTGDACSSAITCAPGSRCLGTPETCRALKAAGGACTFNGECYGGQCESNICIVTTIDCSK